MQRQKGTVTVEFAVAGLLFLTLVFGVIEAGRALFVWNTVEEATRRGARVAAVCPANHSAIARTTIFEAAGGGESSPILSGLTTAHVQLDYLTADGASATSYPDVAYVRVSVSGYEYDLFMPFGRITVPASATTLPAESLGYNPDLKIRMCFGTLS